ncbi:Telomere repeat-binding factor 2 [Linum grandiflorum]
MGAPKQKWTAEEEAALKAGVVKHGTGKWRTILQDPEYSSVLRLRSNVDLKDKWRNINVTAIWGSRQKAKLALKGGGGGLTPKRDESSSTPTSVIHNNEEVADPKPLAICSGTPPSRGSKELLPKLGSLILEAITTLREPSGSDRASIAMYIEERKLLAVPNLGKLLAGKLKLLTISGKLIKEKHKYRIAQSSPILRLDGKQKNALNSENISPKIVTNSQVQQEILRIKGMTAEEAVAAAAKAVAEAEAAIAEAEEAAREAERAEAEAEACQVYAEAAKKVYKYRARQS